MIKHALLYIPAFLFLLLSFIPENELVILPHKGEKRYRCSPYVDYLDTTRGSLGTLSGNSDSAIVFEYTLRMVNNVETIKPISGFTMMFDKKLQGKYLDISSYDYLDIEVSVKEASSFILYLKTFEHFTDTSNWMTQRYLEKEVVLQPRVSAYRLAFKDFSTPNWWKSMIGPRFLTLPKTPDFSKLIAMDFQNTPGGPLDIPERMEIRKIEFRKDRRLLYWTSFGGFFLWVFSLTAILLFRYRKNRLIASTAKPIKHVTLGNQSEEHLTRLATYIGSNFQVPDLSVESVSKETGISLPRISALLQQKYHMNFKQYLNDVRITESKHLLKGTDRTIAEIAFAVGYNSIPHFNRVFRQLTETTPTEFRETERKGS